MLIVTFLKEERDLRLRQGDVTSDQRTQNTHGNDEIAPVRLVCVPNLQHHVCLAKLACIRDEER